MGSPDKFKNINVVLRKPSHLRMDENLILNLCKDSEPVQMCRFALEAGWNPREQGTKEGEIRPNSWQADFSQYNLYSLSLFYLTFAPSLLVQAAACQLKRNLEFEIHLD